MKNYFKLFLCLFLIAAGLQASAQTGDPHKLPAILPPSPNASELGKFGNIPVSLSTGAITYNIPLLDFSIGAIKLNVGLAYNGGGIKVDQIASRAGLGWILDAGGVVNRTVYGDADESSNWAPVPSSFSGNDTATVNFLDRATLSKDHYDTQPDIFSFNFNGYSGKFMLNPTDKSKIIFLERSNLKIETNFTAGNVTRTIKITDPNGIKYYFGGTGATEKSRSLSGGSGCGKTYDTGIQNAWYLNKIKDLNGDSIVFTYLPIVITYETAASQTNLVQDFVTRSQSLYDSGVPGYIYPAPASQTLCISSIINDGVYLDKIVSSNNEQIKFSYTTRTDISNELLFSKLEYGLVGSTALKTFNLTYDIAAGATGYSSASSSPENGYRPFLTQLRTYGKGLTDYKTFDFHYYNKNGLPQRLAYAQDSYGFFNGAANSGFLPDAMVSGLFSYTPADRSSNGSYASYGMLSKVIYPTLGSDSIIYEAHDFNGAVVGGARVKQVITHDPVANKDVVKSYLYKRYPALTVSSGLILREPQGYFSPVSMELKASTGAALITTYTLASSGGNSSLYAESGNHIAYTDVIEYDGTDYSNGGTLHQYNLNIDTYPTVERGLNFPNMPFGVSGFPAITERYQMAFRQPGDGSKIKLKEVFTHTKSTLTNSLHGYQGRKNYTDLFYPAQAYDMASYPIEAYWNYTDSNKVVTYDLDGLNPVTELTENFYDDTTHLQLTRTRTTGSDGRLITRQMSYPHEMVATSQDPTGVYAGMLAVNKIAPVIEEKVTLPSNQLISLKRTNYYEFFTGLFLPKTIDEYNNVSTTNETRIRFLKYDVKGNPLSLTMENGMMVNYVWSFGRTRPIAEVKNVDYATLESAVGLSTLNSVAGFPNPAKATTEPFVAGIRTSLPNAQITSYSYIQGVGATSVTDAKGLATNYEYDGFGRLQNVKDKDGYIVKNYAYAFAPTSPSGKNYVTETSVKVSGKTDTAALAGLTVTQVNKNTQYIDGLGRPLQTVQWKASPGQKDLVQLAEYDAYGREAKKYLPYAEQSSADGSFKATALTNQSNFYSSGSGWDANIPKTVQPYSISIFDHSPLNKVVEQGAPGAVWQPYNAGISGSGHTIKITEGTNLTADSVKLWTLTSTGAQTTAYYANSTLYKITTKDENWASGKAGTTEEFKDKQGRVILKKIWQDETVSLKTWYVYNDLGNLSYVIPPGVNTAVTTSFTESATVFTDFIYGYHYDGRNRLIEKKIPGKAWEYMVYNKLDQLIFSQDAFLRAISRWQFVKYDALGRIIITGIISSGSSRSSLQSDVDAETVLWETRDVYNASGTGIGYTNNTLPAHGSVFYYNVINYYDDYTFNGNVAFNPSVTESYRTKGLLTGSSVNIVNTASRLLTITYYDEDGRPLEIVSGDHLGGINRVLNTYSFANELTATKRTHTLSSVTTTIANTFTYDHAGRKLTTTSKINGNPAVVLSKLDYNEVGQLKQKNLHSTDGGSTFLQNTKFAYNERGWLKGNTAAEFKMRLGYDTTANPQYSGNISTQLWGSSLSNKFLYTYDKLNRLTNGTSTGIVMSEALTYDKMGNIKTLNRDAGGNATYSYSGNQLTGISGGGLTTGSYVYDANGNATTDGRNGVTLEYNFLNLPITATKSGLSIAYAYTATGEKLKKVSNTGGTTDYIDGIQYQAGVIDFIQTEDGLAKKADTTYIYQYNLTDHLGNVRYTFNKNPSTGLVQKLQEDNYYAFGKRKIATGGNNKYLYNGKELQEELGQYDYGARLYDAEIGRWVSIDPLAEKDRKSTGYNYAFNNPLLFIDPDGMLGDYYDVDGTYIGNDGHDDKKVFAVEKGDYEKTSANTSVVHKSTELKGITNEILLAFAAVIHNESGGDKTESYAIGNVTMNFIDNGGSRGVPTLEDAVMYNNTFAQGATQENYADFMKLSPSEQNSRSAVGAAINAIGSSQKLSGFKDYSSGANSWDGVDLVVTKNSNIHRNYIWNSNSMEMLTKYKNDNGGGVNVSAFSYKSSGYQISASKIIGKTLYTELQGGRGERNESKVRFKR